MILIYFYFNEMPKIAIKKQVKKKQVKKNVRNTLMRKNEKKENVSDSITPSMTSPINPLTNTSMTSLHNNSLRAQLLARASMTPTLGFAPQQYGNINNERRIDQLRNDNNTMSSLITSEKAQIEAMEKQKTKLESDKAEQKKMIKELKKQLKDKENEFEKTQIERDMASDKLKEGERVDMRTKQEEERRNTIQQRMQEQTRENNIIQYKKEADNLESELHQAKLKREQLQEAFEKNKVYKRIQELQEEIKLIQNENATLMDVMKDDAFINPNKELMRLEKEKMKQQYQNELYKEQIEKQKQLNNLKIQQQSIPQEDLDAVTKQHVETMKALNSNILEQQENMRPTQQQIDNYMYLDNKINELNRKKIELGYENDKLQAQITKLDSQNKSELPKIIQKHLKAIGHEEVDNEQKKRRIEQATEYRRLREDSYKNDVKVQELDQDLTEEEQQQIINMENQRAYNEQQQRNIETMRTTNQLMYDKIKNDAELNALNKGISSETKQLIENSESIRGQINDQNQMKNAIMDYNNAQLDYSKANAAKLYLESDTHNKAIVDIAQKESDTVQLQIMKEDSEKQRELQKKVQEMKIAYTIDNQRTGNGLTDIQQVGYLLDNYATPLMNLNKEKHEIVNQIINLKGLYAAQWEFFEQKHPGVTDVLNNLEHINIETLKSILNGFNALINGISQE